MSSSAISTRRTWRSSIRSCWRIGLVVLVPLAVFIYLRQKWNLPSVPPLLRFVLTATRVLILLLLVLVLGSPYLKIDHTSEKKPIVALLFDHSQSMQLHAGPFESEDEYARIAAAAGYRSTNAADSETRRALNRISRAKLAQSVVQTAQPLLEKLSQKYDLQYWSFAKDMTQLGVNPAKPKLPEPPNPGGSHTQAGDAIGRSSKTPAAGRSRASCSSPMDRTPAAARRPRRPRRAPPPARRCSPCPSAPSQRLQDVAIVDLFTTPLVSVDDTVRVAVTIESHGFDKRPVKVELKDGDKLLDTKDLMLSGTEQQQVELTFKADAARRPLSDRPRPAAAGRGRRPARQQHRHRVRARQRGEDQGAVRRGAAALGLSLPQERHAPRQRPGRTDREGSRYSPGGGMASPVRRRAGRTRCRARSINWRNIRSSSSATCRRRCSMPVSSICWTRRCASAASA